MDDSNFKHGNTQHGQSKTRTYIAWSNMHKRCRYKPAYKHVAICERWQVYMNFLEDMGECPDGLTLDRISNLLGYCKENCRWATRSVQQWNRRKYSGPTSAFIGVHFYKTTGKWRAAIEQHYKQRHLGYFSSEEAAARAYDDASLRLFGARVNFPEAQADLKEAA